MKNKLIYLLCGVLCVFVVLMTGPLLRQEQMNYAVYESEGDFVKLNINTRNEIAWKMASGVIGAPSLVKRVVKFKVHSSIGGEDVVINVDCDKFKIYSIDLDRMSVFLVGRRIVWETGEGAEHCSYAMRIPDADSMGVDFEFCDYNSVPKKIVIPYVEK